MHYLPESFKRVVSSSPRNDKPVGCKRGEVRRFLSIKEIMQGAKTKSIRPLDPHCVKGSQTPDARALILSNQRPQLTSKAQYGSPASLANQATAEGQNLKVLTKGYHTSPRVCSTTKQALGRLGSAEHGSAASGYGSPRVMGPYKPLLA